MRVSPRFVGALVGLLLLAACNTDDLVIDIPGKDRNEPFDRKTVSQTTTFTLDITTRDANGVETAEFNRGEQIVIEHTLTNLTATVQTFDLPNPGYPWLCLRADKNVPCNWDSQHDKTFPQVVTPIRVDPFKVVKYSFAYGQSANDGTALVAGDYQVKALYGHLPNNEIFATAWHSFEIK